MFDKKDDKGAATSKKTAVASTQLGKDLKAQAAAPSAAAGGIMPFLQQNAPLPIQQVVMSLSMDITDVSPNGTKLTTITYVTKSKGTTGSRDDDIYCRKMSRNLVVALGVRDVYGRIRKCEFRISNGVLQFKPAGGVPYKIWDADDAKKRVKKQMGIDNARFTAFAKLVKDVGDILRQLPQ